MNNSPLNSDARQLEEIILDYASTYFEMRIKANLHKFSKAGRIVISDCLGISYFLKMRLKYIFINTFYIGQLITECFKDGIRFNYLMLNPSRDIGGYGT